MVEIKYKTLWERFKGVITPFFSGNLVSGVLMVAAAITALVFANTDLAPQFHEFWEYCLHIQLNEAELSLTLHEFVNDGLMAIFFFSIGLEIKREIIAGELSNFKKAMLPIIGAVGGIVFPALIYFVINWGTATTSGWGIPIATDIVFALVLLNLMGNKKAPLTLKIFITALAVVDDIFAVLVIAFFYTDQIVFEGLLWAFLFFFVLIGASWIGIKTPLFYGIIGILGIWIGFFLSGVHATIAGVITAIAIPAKVDLSEQQFVKNIRNLIDTFEDNRNTVTVFMEENQLELVRIIQKAIRKTVPPLQAIEKVLHPFVNFIILPLFVLANTGLTIKAESFGLLLQPLSLGIIFGLVLGKFLGISLTTKLASVFKIAKLPKDVQWPQLYGAAAFAGIGFTMSIFIGELAFENQEYVYQAKFAILMAFILAVVLGLIIFRFFVKSKRN